MQSLALWKEMQLNYLRMLRRSVSGPRVKVIKLVGLDIQSNFGLGCARSRNDERAGLSVPTNDAASMNRADRFPIV